MTQTKTERQLRKELAQVRRELDIWKAAFGPWLPIVKDAIEYGERQIIASSQSQTPSPRPK